MPLLFASDPGEIRAQALDLWIDAAVAHAQPPAGVPGVEATLLGWVGGHLRVDRVGPLSVDVSAYGGSSTRSTGGSWLHGAFGAQAGRRLGSVLVGGRAEVFGTEYREPFAYRAYGMSLAPQATRTLGRYTVSARGALTRGRWRLERGVADSSSALVAFDADGPLSITGGAVTAGRTFGPVWLEATTQWYNARNGEADGGYAALGASAAFPIGPAEAQVGATRWSTPAGTELGLNGSLGVRISERLAANMTVERTAPDPLYGSPGSVTASMGMSWHIGVRSLPGSTPVVEIAEPSGRGRKVRFQLPAGKADDVALAGDFTGWAPQPMERVGDLWVLELALEPGLHHFVFVLDGETWYVPDDAPGIVDDGWGRRNASLVVVEER